MLRRWIMAMQERGVVRRVIALACTFAFLTVGLAHSAHSVQHVDAAAFATAVHNASGPVDDASDAAAASTAEHCFACTAPGLPVPEQGVFLVRLNGVPVMALREGARGHPPDFETRPPIATL